MPVLFDRVILKIGPVQSVGETQAEGLFALSTESQHQVISALRVLVTLAQSSADDLSVGQIIVDAGVLPTLLFILQERSGVNSEILRLGCELLEVCVLLPVTVNQMSLNRVFYRASQRDMLTILPDPPLRPRTSSGH